MGLVLPDLLIFFQSSLASKLLCELFYFLNIGKILFIVKNTCRADLTQGPPACRQIMSEERVRHPPDKNELIFTKQRVAEEAE